MISFLCGLTNDGLMSIHRDDDIQAAVAVRGAADIRGELLQVGLTLQVVTTAAKNVGIFLEIRSAGNKGKYIKINLI